MKTVALMGGSGFLGNALLRHLKNAGFQITLFSRSPKSLQKICQINKIPLQKWNFHYFQNNIHALANILENYQIIINLMGANLQKRWSHSSKKIISHSRVAPTKLIAAALEKTTATPKLWLNASAVGCYDPNTRKIHHETSPCTNNSFISQLCKQWESATNSQLLTKKKNIRIASLRTGIVLGKNPASNQYTGALQKILPPFKWGLGFVPGDGSQGFPWISLQDFSLAVQFIIQNHSLNGPINLTAPDTIDFKTFSATLAKLLKKPLRFYIPPLALKILLGQNSQLILQSPNVYPAKLLKNNFAFKLPNLQSALKSILEN